MISKELLSEALDDKVKMILSNSCDVEELVDEEIEENELMVFYDVNYTCYSKYNIYEVAYKCKEWAFDKGYQILSYPSSSALILNTDIKDTCYNTNFKNGKKYDPMCDIEVCQWILDNKKGK